MTTLALHLNDETDQKLEAAAAAQHISKTLLLETIVEGYFGANRQNETTSGKEVLSTHERLQEFCGIGTEGPGDLATNPIHLEDFGKV